MKHISVLVKPASSLCNIRCQYCFYANVSSLREVRSYGKMKAEIANKMIENIFADLEDGDRLTLMFQGGEPTLAGLNYYKNIVSLVHAQQKSVQVDYCMQTNGMIINDAWCAFLKENHFLVGLSIDGNPLFHDKYRLDPKGRGTFHRVLETKRRFDAYQIEYNVLCVLTEELAQQADTVFEFLIEQNIAYVQFIPCLDDLDVFDPSQYALSPESFALFYKRLLELWMKQLKKGKYMSVKLFDDLINLLVAGRVSACGILGNCQIQYVIEADGSVYPCDFYVLDDYRLGYIQEQTLRELFEQEAATKFLCQNQSKSDYCSNCPFFKMCRGGCKRMKDAVYVTKAEDYCGYREFLSVFVPQINTILPMLSEVSK